VSPLRPFRRARALSIAFLLAVAGLSAVRGTAYAAKPAASAKKTVAVGVVNGPQGPKMRARVLDVLRKSGLYEVTDAEDVKPNDKPANYKRVASALQVQGIVVGTVTKAYDLNLTVYGGDGTKIDTLQLKGGNPGKLQKTIDNELEIAIADPLATATSSSGQPAPKPEEEAEEAEPEAVGEEEEAEPPVDGEEESSDDEEEAEPEASDGSAAAKRGRRPIEVILGVRGYNRKFNYTPTPDPYLRSYELNVGPAIVGAVRVYPGAFFTDNTWSHIGIQARYEFGLATTAETPRANGTIASLTTASSEFHIGLRGRAPLGEHELGVFGLFGTHAFTLKGDENPNADPYALVPDVNYQFLRFGVDARFAISKFMVGGHIAPRFLLSMADIDKARVWFPGASGSGLDFGVLVGWRLAPWLSAVGGADVVRYGFDFNAIPSDNRVVAGGASDTYLSVWLGAMVSLEGQTVEVQAQ
jgi:hypothetical protein